MSQGRGGDGPLQQIGLTSKNLRDDQIIQQRRIMAYNVPPENCTLRDASLEEIAALKQASGLCSIQFAPSTCDREALGGTGDLHPHIEITTPGDLGLYLFGADLNVKLVHSVTASSAAVDKKKKTREKELWLGAHRDRRDVDSKCCTGKKSLPDLTFTVARYVACEKGGKLLRIARLVYVHWVYSSSSAVARSTSSSGALAAKGRSSAVWAVPIIQIASPNKARAALRWPLVRSSGHVASHGRSARRLSWLQTHNSGRFP